MLKKFLPFLFILPCAFADDAHVWVQTHSIPQNLELVEAWDFSDPESLAPWGGEHACELRHEDGALAVTMTGEDPYFSRTFNPPEVGAPTDAQWLLRVRLRKSDAGTVAIYWGNTLAPGFHEDRIAQVSCPVPPNTWTEVDLPFENPAPLTHLRLDVSGVAGTAQIARLELYRVKTPPVTLEILPSEVALNPELAKDSGFPKTSQTVRARITNRFAEQGVDVTLDGRSAHFEPGEAKTFEFHTDPRKPVDSHTWTVECAGFPTLKRTVSVIHEVPVPAGWETLTAGNATLRIAPNNALAYIYIADETSATQKLVGAIESFPDCEVGTVDGAFVFRAIESYGLPVVHVAPPMVYAILPGLEMLENGEWSSSKLDLRIPAHNRFCPPTDWLTQQWMGMCTPGAGVRLQWDDPDAPVTFATPNFADGTPDGRMSVSLIRGSSVWLYVTPATGDTVRDSAALIEAGTREQFSNFQRKCVSYPTDRTRDEMFQMYREIMSDPCIHDANGWGHCAGDHWGRAPYCDLMSLVWRLESPEIPDFPAIVQGGGHIENPTIYFVRNQAQRYYDSLLSRAHGERDALTPEGTVLYDGKYRPGHFENHTLGTSCRAAFDLLRAYTLSGDETLREAGLRATRRARGYLVPRGAQCWEMPLHTPDLLADAWILRANVLAFRITGDREFLVEARRRAFEGLTFVYGWDTPDRPFQFGASIGVLGATNWKAPNWLGRPVQWIGTVYTYALLDLVEVEDSPEDAAFWRTIAEEMTRSTERQIYPEGPHRGLLPDSVDPTTADTRYQWDINPSAPFMLRARLDGIPENIYIRWNDRLRVASPFPIDELPEGSDPIDIHPTREVPFQILVNGKAVEGRGLGD